MNYLMKRIVVDTVTSIANGVMKEIASNMTYTVKLSPGAYYNMAPVMQQVFHRLPIYVDIVHSDNSTKININNINDRLDIGRYTTIYKSTVIWLNVERSSKKYSEFTDKSLTVMNTKKDIHHLKEFINKSFRKGNYINTKTFSKDVLMLDTPGCGRILNKELRSFDSIFISDDIEKQITSSLDNFVNRRDWYYKNKIPYHFGVLLYGSPGTGKSSIAQAIARHVHGRLFVINGDKVCYLPTSFGNDIQPVSNPNMYNIVLVEDIDCGFINDDVGNRSQYKNYNKDEENKKSGLGGILNCIDGIAAPSNTIYVFTTNHIEKLDPALIRPGRIDLSVEIGGVCMETFNKFIKHHYDKTCDEKIKLKDGLTFASLQVEVMKGKSFEEIIKFVEE